ncbi:MAG: NAD(P)-binding protein [Peptococcaceae bacterium]|jgi:Fe-S oxidoreductase|nr:NAD(P)-binding protein [Peptococcaceae bacterium]
MEMVKPRQENNLDLCFHGAQAPCSRACPFDFDIRAYFEKLQRGSMDAAFRLYRNAVIFPDIVWRLCPAPCKDACVRGGTDAPLSMNLLEQACVAYARSREPVNYNVPKKEWRVAVVGAGLSGLTTAIKFASKKYDVTVYEKTGKIGGGLSRFLPEEIYLPEIELQFKHETSCVFELNTQIEDLNALTEDAVYVSSGVDLPGSGGQDGERIFRCPPDVTPIEAIQHGAGVLHEIEWFLKTGHKRPQDDVPKGSVPAPAMELTFTPPVQPAGDSYTKQEAVEEAKRCVNCDCSACMRHCSLLKEYQNYPLRLRDDVDVTMNPTPLFTGRVALRQICSCNQCGLCQKICPARVDVGDYLLRTRRELQATGAFPEAYHDFWLRDMAFANSDQARMILRPGADKVKSEVKNDAAARYAFFPGCQIGGSDPRYVTETYRLLLERLPGAALLLRCCGAPAIWAGDDVLHGSELAGLRAAWEELGRPELLLACPSCQTMLREYLPEIPCRMIYELFAEQYAAGETDPAGAPAADVELPAGSPEGAVDSAESVPVAPVPVDSPDGTAARQAAGAPAGPDSSGDTAARQAAVFDPCASREYPALQQSVRALAAAMGFDLEELPHGQGEAQCCSWGGQIYSANPVYARKIVDTRAAQSEKPYIVYCTNCRDIFAHAGKPCLHILDVLLGLNDANRVPPTVTQRRQNRAALKQTLSARYGDAPPPASAEEEERTAMKLLMDETLTQRMSDDLILEEDVQAVITHCEQTGQKIVKPGAGSFSGHLRRGIITYWVEYTPAKDGGASCDADHGASYRVLNVYSHRMAVQEDDAAPAAQTEPVS